MPITIKSKEQIQAMTEGGRINAGALAKVMEAVKVGVSTVELDKIAENSIIASGGEPGFKRVPNYDFTTCINVNEGVVHGIPSERTLEVGDILTVDLGTFYKGLHTDMAWTCIVGEVDDPARAAFLEAGERALWEALGECGVGNRVGDISAAMERILREGGYTPVESLVGHGVGAELHEEPPIPCLATDDLGPELKAGMTLAVEVIYTAGGPDLKTLPDGWTVVTADGSLAALFEHSVVVTESGPIVLTSLAESASI